MATPKLTTTQKSGVAVGTVGLILAAIFGVEGFHSNDPNDPGGATTFGCTEAVARADGYTGPMIQLSKARCADILRRQFIEKPGYMPIVEREPVLAFEIIDTGVNAGTGRSSPWFQESLNLFSRGGRDYPKITADGKVGPATIAAFDNLRRARGPKKACELMVKSADAYQAAHYQKLCKGSYALSSFCVGWFDHRIGNAPIENCGSGHL